MTQRVTRRTVLAAVAAVPPLLTAPSLIVPAVASASGPTPDGTAGPTADRTGDLAATGRRTVSLSTVTISARTGDRVHRSRTTYGHTVQGTPLVAYRVAHVDDLHTVVRRVFALGCIHGNEQAGISILGDLWRSATPPPLGVEYVFVFHPNPDGERADTRQNARLVDLNRNFAVDWRRRGVRGDLTYSGPSALSEPETRSLVPLVRALAPTIVLSYHQPLNYLGSVGGNQHFAKVFARTVGQRYLSSNAPDGTGQVYTGTMSEWINRLLPQTLMMTTELPRDVSSGMHAAHRRAIAAVARDYVRLDPEPATEPRPGEDPTYRGE